MGDGRKEAKSGLMVCKGEKDVFLEVVREEGEGNQIKLSSESRVIKIYWELWRLTFPIFMTDVQCNRFITVWLLPSRRNYKQKERQRVSSSG